MGVMGSFFFRGVVEGGLSRRRQGGRRLLLEGWWTCPTAGRLRRRRGVPGVRLAGRRWWRSHRGGSWREARRLWPLWCLFEQGTWLGEAVFFLESFDGGLAFGAGDPDCDGLLWRVLLRPFLLGDVPAGELGLSGCELPWSSALHLDFRGLRLVSLARWRPAW